ICNRLCKVACELLQGLVARRAYDDWNAGCCSGGGKGPPCGIGVNDGRPHLDQLRRKRRKSIETVLRKPDVEPDVLAVDIAKAAQRPQEGCEPVAASGRRVRRQNRDPRQITGTLRPSMRADAGDAKPISEEDPPPHSMTSSCGFSRFVEPRLLIQPN